ncbi:MAG: hypothetical protein DME15_02615 [Candidatus Rokuibacteriota bacterium]|nr:MAG: hypothetical protein DME15_02615 [Candidatus Rokubacteria bacterium]PYN58489.1 MAG: hypothetical protein DMD92_12170 [Candidatus Rokubacteria bacterium]
MLLAAGALLAAGCASGEEWTTWADHPAHFASKDHFVFSVRNTEGSQPRVTREDITQARSQSWWGESVTVSQAEILEQ